MSEDPQVEVIYLSVRSELKITRRMIRVTDIVRQQKLVLDPVIYFQPEML
jgi:hypothetical protein